MKATKENAEKVLSEVVKLEEVLDSRITGENEVFWRLQKRLPIIREFLESCVEVLPTNS